MIFGAESRFQARDFGSFFDWQDSCGSLLVDVRGTSTQPTAFPADGAVAAAPAFAGAPAGTRVGAQGDGGARAPVEPGSGRDRIP